MRIFYIGVYRCCLKRKNIPFSSSLAFYHWEALGKPYAELLDDMVKLALKREREEKSMMTSFDSNILQNANLSGAKGVKK